MRESPLGGEIVQGAQAEKPFPPYYLRPFGDYSSLLPDPELLSLRERLEAESFR